MPHLVILYTPGVEPLANMSALCRQLADTMLQATDETGKKVFPPGGVRVLAYPAAHSAIADGGVAGRAAGGDGHYDFVYLNLRMGKGRSEATHHAVGQALMQVTQTFFEPLMTPPGRHMGVTLQIDVGAEVFDGKYSTLHPLFT